MRGDRKKNWRIGWWSIENAKMPGYRLQFAQGDLVREPRLLHQCKRSTIVRFLIDSFCIISYKKWFQGCAIFGGNGREMDIRTLKKFNTAHGKRSVSRPHRVIHGSQSKSKMPSILSEFLLLLSPEIHKSILLILILNPEKK
jgi:hypothetical protein